MSGLRTSLALALAVVLLCSPACAREKEDEQLTTNRGDTMSGEIRRPVVAGAFYPSDPATLAGDVDRYLAAASVAEIEGRIVGIICPHAGYVYSAGVAAHAYVLLKGLSYDSVIVVAPSHRVAFSGASVYGGAGYATPLGVVSVDRALADAIAEASPAFRYEPRAHAAEHSLEVQVPFLQRALGEFAIVPIVMGTQDEGTVRTLAAAIADAVRSAEGKSVLLVASSDLSHYHSYDQAVALDSVVVELVEAYDPEGLLAALARGECEACGGGPMAVVMMAARELGARRATVVKYANSGDVTGDRGQVVGYMAGVLTGEEGPSGDVRKESRPQSAGPTKPYTGLSDREKESLLALARRSIEAALSGGRPPAVELSTEALDTECGAFVTLKKGGRLRGCIGYIQAVKPLWQTVSEMAVQAAMHDPRFPPVVAEELPDIDIEISVLSPLEEVSDVSTIEVGRDGLVIRDGAHSGLLLPQVATEYGWDRETFLEHTCVKAGLPPAAWTKPGVTILRFTAEVFGEEDRERQ